MKKTPDNPETAALRRLAEKCLSESQRGQKSEVKGQRSDEDTARLLHELQVHQIELEMQNEELRTAKAQIEAERARYFDFYNLAPVGYCTLSEHGLILDANLTTATLLGMARGALVKQPFTRFILKDDRNIYYQHLEQVFETHSTFRRGSGQAGSHLTSSVPGGQAGKPQDFELRLVKQDGALFWAHFLGIAVQADDGALSCRMVIRDITERKRAEEALRNSERHLRSTVDGLSAHIAVLDEQGEIILTNKSYRDFGERNGVDPSTVSEGTNYLAVCDTVSGEHSEEAKPFAKGIREVLSGKRQSFELEYPCHSPDEKRWFIGRVTPYIAEGPRRVIVAHENITERKRGEEALKARTAELMESTESLRALTAHLHVIREEERTALARELHDEFGQKLAALQMDLHWMDTHLRTAQPLDVARLRERIAAMAPLTERLAKLTQTVCASLRPSMLDDLGLLAAIEWLAEDCERRTGLPCTLSLPADDLALDSSRALALFRIVQEALTNVARHAQATDVEIGLRAAAGELLLEVKDNGRGFVPESAPAAKALGLLGMRERALGFRGTVAILSEPGQGTTVQVRMPLE